MTADVKLSRRTAWAAVYLERYGISLVFLALAGVRLYHLFFDTAAIRARIQAAPLVETLNQAIWLQLYLCVGLLLLIGRRVVNPPQRARDVIIPLATTFFYCAYAVIPWLPPAWGANVCPVAARSICLEAGVVCGLAGLWIAIWSVVSLGRSFGLLIEVREVVVSGAYRWVRHPMYLGYLLLLTAFVLASFSPAVLVLVPLHAGLLIYRARLEEARLCESSEAYQAYCRRVGFLFPRLF